MLSEFSAEKDRMLKEMHQKEQELDSQREKLLRDKKEMAEHLNREFNEKVRMIEKRNQVRARRESFIIIIITLLFKSQLRMLLK